MAIGKDEALQDFYMTDEEREAQYRRNFREKQLIDCVAHIVQSGEGRVFFLELLHRWDAETFVSAETLALRNEAEWILDIIFKADKQICLQLIEELRNGRNR